MIEYLLTSLQSNYKIAPIMQTTASKHPLVLFKPLLRRIFNRAWAIVYAVVISAVIYNRGSVLLRPTAGNFASFCTGLLMLLSDFVLAFMWLNSQGFRMNPVVIEPLPKNVGKILTRPEDYPALDVFICTVDPTKEPPLGVAATALSAMAYDYPAEKLSVYVSDDGGSKLTLFALAEAAKFAKAWLPFCKENRILERSPEAYFGSGSGSSSDGSQKMKKLYENMKTTVENVSDESDFNPTDHPPRIQVLSQNSEDKDVKGVRMPNLIYVSREKRSTIPHHFKAGALNVLLRVSSTLTNGPILLTLDCDMISNDPSTPNRMLCYFLDSSLEPNLAYVQFPVQPRGINKADIYGSEFRRVYYVHPTGLNGLSGPDYFGTGTFFSRRALHNGLSSNGVVKKSINDPTVLELAHHVASCDYEYDEKQSNWGSKIGFRYGSLVEDFYTSYRLHCEGWKSVFCNPERRPAFLSETPISLIDVITQLKRWSVGLLEITISKYSTLTFGIKFLGPLMAQCYSFYACGPIWSFPIMVYSFLPQAMMLKHTSIFPKVSDPWFFLYIFLFVGAYGQDLLEFIQAQGTIRRWWSDQRLWLIRGLSADLFGSLEYITNRLGISARGFNVTNKASDTEIRKRYDQGKFEFGVASPMFVPLATAAIVNLVAFSWGIWQVLKNGDIMDELWVQFLLASFGVANGWPVYEAMILRSDQGKMPAKVTVISVILAWFLFAFFPV